MSLNGAIYDAQRAQLAAVRAGMTTMLDIIEGGTALVELLPAQEGGPLGREWEEFVARVQTVRRRYQRGKLAETEAEACRSA